MPARTEDYEVLLDFTNDTHECATVQLLRDYGRNSGAIVLLRPGESVTLVLEAGMYKISISAISAYPDALCRFSVPICAKNALESGQCDVGHLLLLSRISC